MAYNLGTFILNKMKGNSVEESIQVSFTDPSKFSVAVVDRPSWPEETWNGEYGKVGHTENWAGTESLLAVCPIGSYFLIRGTATDTGNFHTYVYKRGNSDRTTLWGECVAHMVAPNASSSGGVKYDVFTVGKNGLVPAPTSGDNDKYLKGDGSWSSPATYNAFTGASSDAAGTSGLTPAPAAGDQNKYLKGDGTWATPQYLPLTGGTLTGHLYGQYLVGTWLQSTSFSRHSQTQDRICVFDGRGWIYYRTLDDLRGDLSMSGASASADGKAGTIPQPKAGDQAKFLRGDGTWQEAGGGSKEATSDQITTMLKSLGIS